MVHQHNIHASVYSSGTTNFLRYRNHKVNMAYSSGQYNQRFKVDLASSQVKFQDEFASRFGVDLPALAETQSLRTSRDSGFSVELMPAATSLTVSTFCRFLQAWSPQDIRPCLCGTDESARGVTSAVFLLRCLPKTGSATPRKLRAQPPAHRRAPKHTHIPDRHRPQKKKSLDLSCSDLGLGISLYTLTVTDRIHPSYGIVSKNLKLRARLPNVRTNH